MNIPEGVNQKDFVKQAHGKGVTVSSRYKGVHLHRGAHGNFYWGVWHKVNGKRKVKLFKLNEFSERLAAQYYQAKVNAKKLPAAPTRNPEENIADHLT